MGALPQPVVAPGPHRELVDTLHSLHHRAGWPSLRQLARETGVSHTTVSKVLSSATLPAWGNLELLTEALHGDVAHMHDLWLAASTPADTDDASVARIAGRVDELAALRRHLETGAGMLLVTGEAGMGKTTLVAAAAESVDTVVAVGRCLQLSSEVPLLPFIDALRFLHQTDAGRWMDEALADCPTYVRASLGRLLPELLPGSTPTSVADDPWGQERLFSSVTAVLRALAATRPLALHLEDCHWADRGTLDLLTHMASHPSGVPVVVTWRSGDPDVAVEHSEWLLRNRWAPGVRAIDLRPLTLEETTRQLQLLTGARVDDEGARTIHARGQGLPLYTAQLATVAPDAEMPRHLAELLDRRIGDLHGAAWRVARLLGVAQRQMAPATLRAATGLDADEEDDAMHLLERRGLLQHTLGGAGLPHPLFIEAIERRLLPGEAADTHARLAEALESAPAIQPGEVADHWRAAERPDREVVLRVAAARRANERFAQREALDAWLRVLELWDDGHRDGDTELWQVLVLALDVAIGLGDLDAGRVLAARAASLDLPAGPRAQVLQRVGSFLYEDGDLAGAEAALDDSLRLVEALPSSSELLRVLEERFWMFLQSGRHVEAHAALTRSLSILDAHEDPALRRRTLAGAVLLEMDTTGDVEASLAIARRASEAAIPEPDPVADLMIAASVTDVLLRVPSSAVRAGELGAEALRSGAAWGLEHTFPAVLVRGNVCWAHLREGNTRAAREWVEPVTRAAPVVNSVYAHVMLAAVELREGNLAAARERLSSADAQVRNHDQSWAECLPWIAEVELWGGRANEAVELLAGWLEPRLTTETAGQAAPLLVVLARGRADLVDASTPDLARRHAVGRELRDVAARASVDPFGADVGDPARPAMSVSWQAELSRVEAAATVETWVRAAKAWDDLARPHDAAYCRWRAAQCALLQGQGSIAARLLTRASTDAHQHVPLREAIAATARGA